MKAPKITLCAVVLLFGLVLLTCNKESDQIRCENDSECDGGYICTEGLCQLFEQNDIVCEPDCDRIQCGPDPLCGESCGTCSSETVCHDGHCKVEGTFCEYECSVDDCEVCSGPECVSICTGYEVCDAGTCVPYGHCDPSVCEILEFNGCVSACEPYDCQTCWNFRCVSNCLATEVCMACYCISAFCDPSCSGEVSFCNEIYKCVSSDCEEMNCTQYDPNMHCAESTEGVGCFCNPGWILNEEQTGCVMI